MLGTLGNNANTGWSCLANEKPHDSKTVPSCRRFSLDLTVLHRYWVWKIEVWACNLGCAIYFDNILNVAVTTTCRSTQLVLVVWVVWIWFGSIQASCGPIKTHATAHTACHVSSETRQNQNPPLCVHVSLVTENSNTSMNNATKHSPPPTWYMTVLSYLCDIDSGEQ